MNEEQRKSWEELVSFTKVSNAQIERPEFLAILAADAELTRLRAEVEDLKVKLFDATSCLSCDLNYSGAPCTCTDDKKRYVGKLRAIVARVEDVEGMAKVLYEAHTRHSWTNIWATRKGLLAMDVYRADARALRNYALGEG